MQICAPDTSTSQSALKCRPLPAALLISKPTEWHRETVVLFHPNQPCWTLCQHCSQRVVSGSCHTCSVCRHVKSAPRTTTEATNNIVLCTLSFILLWSASTKCSGYNCRGTFYFFFGPICAFFFCCKSRAMALGIWPSVFIQCLKINAHAQSLMQLFRLIHSGVKHWWNWNPVELPRASVFAFFNCVAADLEESTNIEGYHDRAIVYSVREELCKLHKFESFLIQLSEAEHSLVPITQIHLQQLEKVKFWIIKTWTTEVYSIVKNLKVFKCMCLNQEMSKKKNT